MTVIGNHNYDNLFAGDADVITGEATMASGSTYSRGTVIGTATASGLSVAVDSALTDGAESAYAILAADVDASEGDQIAPVYLSGQFNENALTFGGTDSIDEHKETLRTKGIFTKKNQEA